MQNVSMWGQYIGLLDVSVFGAADGAFLYLSLALVGMRCRRIRMALELSYTSTFSTVLTKALIIHNCNILATKQ